MAHQKAYNTRSLGAREGWLPKGFADLWWQALAQLESLQTSNPGGLGGWLARRFGDLWWQAVAPTHSSRRGTLGKCSAASDELLFRSPLLPRPPPPGQSHHFPLRTHSHLRPPHKQPMMRLAVPPHPHQYCPLTNQFEALPMLTTCLGPTRDTRKRKKCPHVLDSRNSQSNTLLVVLVFSWSPIFLNWTLSACALGLDWTHSA